MKLNIKVYGAVCRLSEFSINNIEAEEEDFVDKYDHSPETAEDYGCGNMQADIKEATIKVLEKYNITQNEYQKIAEEVSRLVSFGACSWCV